MIRCPECGQEAADDAKFCDRCGQGLSVAPRSMTATLKPLEPGTELRGRYRIVELLTQLAEENRYRAEILDSASNKLVQLRERRGPESREQSENNPAAAEKPLAMEENPTGPHAKTAELRLRAQVEQTNGGNETNLPEEPVVEISAAAPERGGDGDLALADQAQSPDPLEQSHESEAVENDAIEGEPDDLGEVFGRVMALSMTLKHPALVGAIEGFAENDRVYLVYPDERLSLLAHSLGHGKLSEPETLNIGVQLCQIVGFFHRRALRINDLCPESIAFGEDGRIRLTGLEYVSNDDEMQDQPIFNDGYSAPEIYKGRKVDKRADIFSIGAVLYTCLTGERIESESWREEAGPIRFYPPHVVTPVLEQIVRRALLFDPAARWSSADELKAELVSLNGQVRIRAAALTDVGMVRELNEDTVMTVEYWRDSQVQPAEGFLYLIADGMGGAEAGEIASAIAADTIRSYVECEFGKITPGAIGTLLQESLEEANRQVLAYQSAHPEARGMGSTAVATLIVPPDASIAWVGDSRGYLCDERGLRQLTKDHSLVQRLVEIGQITPEEARHHEHKNVITRSLGARSNGLAGAEVVNLRLKRGERLMLCSDGLTAHVEDRGITEILRRHSDPTEAARELVVAANAGGGTDNISVVVIFTN